MRAVRLPTVRLLAGVLAGATVFGVGGCGSDGPTADPELFCQRLDRLASNDPFDAFGDVATPDQVETAFAALRERAAELVEVAPERARSAADEYRAAVIAIDDLLRGAGYSSSVDPQAYQPLQLDYIEAAQRLERFLEAEC